MDQSSAHALIRFGLGRRGAEALPPDPIAWLTQQIIGPDLATFPAQPTTVAALIAIREQREIERQERLAEAQRVAQEGTLKPNAAPLPTAITPGVPLAPKETRPAQKLFRADAAAQIDWLMQTDSPFRERLVWFWTNHFTVSLRQGGTGPLIGPFMREAIRPHVAGRFSEMVLAVMRHPAMLMYLDQEGSVGPNSPAGVRQHRGLNENLARECM